MAPRGKVTVASLLLKQYTCFKMTLDKQVIHTKLTLENIEAYTSQFVNVWVIYFGHEANLRS